jgi:hypothetical protein
MSNPMQNPKGCVLEFCTANKLQPPGNPLLNRKGPDHAPLYAVSLQYMGRVFISAQHTQVKAAHEDLYRQIWHWLNQRPMMPPVPPRTDSIWGDRQPQAQPQSSTTWANQHPHYVITDRGPHIIRTSNQIVFYIDAANPEPPLWSPLMRDAEASATQIIRDTALPIRIPFTDNIALGALLGWLWGKKAHVEFQVDNATLQAYADHWVLQ